MFDDLLLHETTRRHLEAFISRPAHALLVSGPAGAGKKQLARRLTAALFQIEPAGLQNHPQFLVISKPEDKAEIPIDSARQLIKKLTLKVPGATTIINRVAIIEDADLLSGEAQNALLKLLEEPPEGSLLILTSSRTQNLLPTVVSRLQRLNLRPVTLEQSRLFFKDYKTTEVESAWRLSRGASSLLASLLNEGQDHQMKQVVEEAKRLLSLKSYERLGYIQSAAKDKAHFTLLLEALSRILGVLHQANLANPSSAKKILSARKIVLTTQESLEKNTNLRLLSLNLALNMPV